MKSHYKRIGNFVTKIKKKNFDNALSAKDLKGININKYFMPSVANINGTDLSKYRIVSKRQFSFNPMHVGRDEVLPIAIHKQDKPIIVSPAYVVFEIKNTEILSPEYLMMCCSRLDFDRKALFMTDNSIRGNLSWEDFCDIDIPIPPIEKQREIVREYNVVNDRIKMNEKISQKLEKTAQAIYKQWFVDFEFPITKEYAESIGKPELEGKSYKSSGSEMAYCDELDKDIPIGWNYVDLRFFIKDFLGGGWGKEFAIGNYTTKTRCIRGTDIPKFRRFITTSLPTRFILEKNLKNIALKTGDIVVEISGGSPIQSTGRSLLINKFFSKYIKCNLICSNFCKILQLENIEYSNYLYQHLLYLYSKDQMFIYENSTTGVKNFNIENFLSLESAFMPDKGTVKIFNKIMDCIFKNTYIHGREEQYLTENITAFISKFIFKTRG
jgi:restriction endonuclease S subunit